MQKIAFFTCLWVIATLTLGACGIKPKNLDAPTASEDADAYPRVYPSSSLSSK